MHIYIFIFLLRPTGIPVYVRCRYHLPGIAEVRCVHCTVLYCSVSVFGVNKLYLLVCDKENEKVPVLLLILLYIVGYELSVTIWMVINVCIIGCYRWL